MSDPQPRLSFALESVLANRFVEHTGDLPDDPGADIAVVYAPAFELGFDEDEGLLEVLVELRVERSDGDSEDGDEDRDAIAEIEVLCQWVLRNLNDIRDSNGDVRFPRALLAHLVGISLSTTRGVLIGRAKHGIFGRAPLPIRSPLFFIDELVEEEELDWVEKERVLQEVDDEQSADE